MSTTTVYRVQPKGMGLDHRTEASDGSRADGVHVFGCLNEMLHGVEQWCEHDYTPEILVIECDECRDLRDNGDWEGYLLRAGRGRIVRRRAFRSWAALLAWCARRPTTV